MSVKKGDVVKVHYTGKLSNGEQFDSSAGREPLEFTVGAGMMIAGFDKGVEGMLIGEKKVITIKPEEGYGEWREENVISFPSANVPADMKLEVGMALSLRDDRGMPVNVVVKEILPDTIMLDANHFLAGKDLIFDVELVEINGNKSIIITP